MIPPDADDPPTMPGGDEPTVHSGDAPTVFSNDAPTVFSAGDGPTAPIAEAATILQGADAPTTLTPGPATARPATARSATPTPTGGSKSQDGPLTVGDAFGRYTIVRLLGIGGMGAVYQAWDSELDVVVALKVIRPETLRDPAAEQEIERRFKRELLLARQVTHKNVVRIHDLGEIRGIKYITMSYVDGTDLSSMLKQQKRLSVADTMRIMRGVVSGLTAASNAGVVHRDLKPANIMVGKDGEALIMDFGIARSSNAATEVAAAGSVNAIPDAANLPDTLRASKYTEATVLGAIVGTVEYMAPEQALGQPVDQRADIYTTGLIFYDLLSGIRRADQKGNALERLRARMEKGLPPIKVLNPEVSDALAAIITRAIEIDQTKRYQTTAELAEDLARLDDNGVPLPVKRSVSIPMMAGIVALVALVASGAWWYFRPTGPEKPHDPVSVVIADVDNRTGEPGFDRTVEPMLRRALEGAGFITAYDRVGIRRVVGAALPEKLDEAAARDIAVKQGLGVVLSGTIEKQGSAYNLSLKATKYLPKEEVVSEVKGRASGQDQVIPTATKLVASVRKALGDRTTNDDKFFAAMSLSASSIDAVRYYAAAQEASANTKFEEAQQNLLKAVEIDPNFGVGYLALAGTASSMRKPEEATKYINEALKHLDGMTEREKYTTRGMSFRLSGDYKQCVAEHGELIKRFAADVIGHNQLALCASLLRDFSTARDQMQAIVQLLPRRTIFRANLSFYSSYVGDFVTGEEQARKITEISPSDQYGKLGLALAQIGQGQIAPAIETFTALANVDADGKPVFAGQAASISASGLGDMAVYEGRYADAVHILERGAAADLAGNFGALAAAKYAEEAYAQLSSGQKAAAVASAQKALDHSKAVKIRFMAARTFIEAGQAAKAAPLMKDLSAELQPEPQAYGKILEAELALTGKDPRPAIKLLTDANALVDTWIGQFELGRAYLATEQFLQADSQFDKCVKRRGEAISLFLDEEPTFGYYPMAYYYQGRAREALNQSSGAAASYRAYLTAREKAGQDPLIAEVKRRVK